MLLFRAKESDEMNTQASMQLLRVEEAAAVLNVKPSTIRAWLSRRKLSKVRIGERAIRIPREELERLIAEGTIPAKGPRSAR